MKVCNVCGETYQNLVEFCFVDGVVLNSAADAMDVPMPGHLPVSQPPEAQVSAAGIGSSTGGLVSTAEVPSYTPMADRVTEGVDADPEADAETHEGSGTAESAAGQTLVPELNGDPEPAAPEAPEPVATGTPAAAAVEEERNDGGGAVPRAAWSGTLLLGLFGALAFAGLAAISVGLFSSGSDTVVIEPKVVPATAPAPAPAPAAAAAPSEAVEAEPPSEPAPADAAEDGDADADSDADAVEPEATEDAAMDDGAVPETPEEVSDGVAAVEEPAAPAANGEGGPEPVVVEEPEPEAEVEAPPAEVAPTEVSGSGDAPDEDATEAAPEAAPVEPAESSAARTGPVIIFHQGHTGQVVQVNGGAASGDLPFRTELAGGANTFVIVLADGETVEIQRVVELKPPGQTTLIHLDR